MFDQCVWPEHHVCTAEVGAPGVVSIIHSRSDAKAFFRGELLKTGLEVPVKVGA